MTFKSLLDQEIENEFSKLSSISSRDDDYKTAIDGLTKLMDRAIEIEKLESENRIKTRGQKLEAKVANFDIQYKDQSSENERKNRLIQNCIAIAGIVVPSMITIWGTVKSLEFEKEGSVTTIVGRGFINKLLPKSKV